MADGWLEFQECQKKKNNGFHYLMASMPCKTKNNQRMTNSRQYGRWIKIAKQIASKRTNGLPKKLNIKETAKGREGNTTDLRKEPHHFLTSISVPFFYWISIGIWRCVWHFLLSISLRSRRLKVVGARKNGRARLLVCLPRAHPFSIYALSIFIVRYAGYYQLSALSAYPLTSLLRGGSRWLSQ